MKTLVITLLTTFSTLAANQVTINIEGSKDLIVTADALYYATNTSFRCKQLRSNGGIFPNFHSKLKTKIIQTKNGKITTPRTLNGYCAYKLDSLSLKVRTKDVKSYNATYVAAYMTASKGFSVRECQVNGTSPIGTAIDGVACYGDPVSLDKNDETTIQFNLK